MTEFNCMVPDCKGTSWGYPLTSAKALRGHHTKVHTSPAPNGGRDSTVPCVELTCAGVRTEHTYGSAECSYTFDPIEGVNPKAN